MDIRGFRDDIESAPFHIASIFNDPDDNLWAWQYLFNDLCDKRQGANSSPKDNRTVPLLKEVHVSGLAIRNKLEALNANK